ncbi:hypothetical protein G3R49_19475 [Shewanella sp. WXL01]|uniref:Uncharacterized protein n=1 Tax=Shewanella maritima TaxID=2520507 RepID=A0A411PIG1_9GAMM|nr:MULTISPECIES: hypothetical protein [Shewanella]NKF52741.1 hypothetical protein [Shewanella sp. WXL01]QBF83376.1 hypothetical protein EXU30_12215 [Shewanella maritima]
MSVIKSIGQQWQKAEYAHQLNHFFAKQSSVRELFVAATPATTVCNLIAAMCQLPNKSAEDAHLSLNEVFPRLFDCYILLFVKQAEHQQLSQAEQLICSITLIYAKQILNDAQSTTEQTQTDELIEQAKRVVAADQQLAKSVQAMRRSQSNMGKY